jgi:hypothetical protein
LLLLLLLLGIRAAERETGGARLDKASWCGLRDQILRCAVGLKAGCRKTWDNVPWRESIGGIWTSERTTDARSRTKTWWSLRRAYDE